VLDRTSRYLPLGSHALGGLIWREVAGGKERQLHLRNEVDVSSQLVNGELGQ